MKGTFPLCAVTQQDLRNSFLFDFLAKNTLIILLIHYSSIPKNSKDGTPLYPVSGEIQDLWWARGTPELPPWQDAVFLLSLWKIFYTVWSHEDTHYDSHWEEGIWLFAVWQGFLHITETKKNTTGHTLARSFLDAISVASPSPEFQYCLFVWLV